MKIQTIKDRVYSILKEDLNGRATEKQLTQKYIEKYPDYDKNHTRTKTSSFAKLSGSINAEISRNKLHKNIKVDKGVSPEEYFIVPNNLSMPVIIQPIGNRYTKENFLESNYDRWAESIEYKKNWKKSLGAIVLFVKDAKVFAKGTITKIEENNSEKKYQLNYYYELEEVDDISYEKIYDYSEYDKFPYFKTFFFLNNYRSVKILSYIYSLNPKEYFDDHELDDLLENNFDNIIPVSPERKPQKPPEKQDCNGINKYRRNGSYAKQALEQANYECEINSKHTTFISKATNKQYMEAHHLFPMSAQEEISNSLDIPANIIALCPECHRKIHFAKTEEKNEIILSLYKNRESELKIFGITETSGDLLEIYKNYKV